MSHIDRLSEALRQHLVADAQLLGVLTSVELRAYISGLAVEVADSLFLHIDTPEQLIELPEGAVVIDAGDAVGRKVGTVFYWVGVHEPFEPSFPVLVLPTPDAAGGDYECTCPHYVVDRSDPEPHHPENIDRELDPNCPEHGARGPGSYAHQRWSGP